MIETLIKCLRGLGKRKLMCSGFAEGHSAKTSKKQGVPENFAHDPMMGGVGSRPEKFLQNFVWGKVFFVWGHIR